MVTECLSFFSQPSRPLHLRRLLKPAVVELGVEAALFEQFLMRAALQSVAVLHHEDAVGVPDGADALRGGPAVRATQKHQDRNLRHREIMRPRIVVGLLFQPVVDLLAQLPAEIFSFISRPPLSVIER